MRQEKQLLLDQIKDQIEDASAFVLTGYNKLGANITYDLRTKLRGTGGKLLVLKKRVFLKAIENSGVDFDKDDLPGHIGVILAGEDAVGATKALYDFKKTNEELIEILGGLFEGTKCSAQDVAQISKLPSKDQMRSELLGLFEAPMAQSLSVMEALLTSVMHCLENKSKQES